MTPVQLDWVRTTAGLAAEARHIYPEMAACEAALESAFGQSELAREGNNLFGLKLHRHSQYGYLVLPTKEFLDNEWVVQNAQWMKYDYVADCFEDRMATLQRLAPMYPHYAAALAAPDVTIYVVEVSKTWSTDPERADKVISIYREFQALRPDSVPGQPTNHSTVQDAAAGEV